MPMPVSAMASTMQPSAARPRTVTRPPAGVNFTALDKQIEHDLLERAAVGAQPELGRNLRDQLELLVLRARRDDAHGFGQQGIEVELLEIEADAAGLDLGHVENVVDDVEQILAAAADVACNIRCIFRRRAGRTWPTP